MTKFQEEQIWEITQELNRSYELRTEYDKVFNELEDKKSFSLLPYFEKMEKAYIKAIKNLKERNENL